MKKDDLGELREYILNEEKSWPFVQELRKTVENAPIANLMNEVNVDSREKAMTRANEIAQNILSSLKEMDVNFQEVEPGHGIGHLTRDYLHALRLGNGLDVDPKHLFIGILGGIFHDILGCIMVKRYDENERVVRHAEGGGIFFYRLGEKVGLSEAEKMLGFYAIAAHTHYLKPIPVKYKDGTIRESTPYVDLDEFGKPLMCVWLTRWTDRLDVNGPCFVGRHFLTLAESHKDFSGGSFYSVTFESHMNPFLRNEDEIKQSGKRTMREHITMFANSQNNQTPYGKHDFGTMVEIRDSYTARIRRIIATFDEADTFSLNEKLAVLKNWNRWLTERIEPTEKGRETVGKLDAMFANLNQDFRDRWYNVFSTTRTEHMGWSNDMRSALKDFSETYFTLPVLGDVRKILF